MRKRKLSVGDLVVFNHTHDAAIFRVAEIQGFRVGVTDRTMEDMNGGNGVKAAVQWVDRSSMLTPTFGQLNALL